ncbi:MAG: putative rane-anchored protein, partial [Verrucomicrobia bacterium]|nr:putative rane-anchored protein [Verrucomicrobiota bacterium]
MNTEHQGRFHPQYRELHAELLARPFPVVAGHVMVAHRAILFTPAEASEHRAAVAALSIAPGVAATPEAHGFQLLRVGVAELRIERHTEFTTFTVFAPQKGEPFAESAIDHLPAGWLEAIPGRIMAAVEIASELVPIEEAGSAPTMERVLECFGQER